MSPRAARPAARVRLARTLDTGIRTASLLASAARLGIPMAPFPFTAAGHIIHRGRGRLAAVHATGDRSHPSGTTLAAAATAYQAPVTRINPKHSALRSPAPAAVTDRMAR